jgi:hypothetical protein
MDKIVTVGQFFIPNTILINCSDLILDNEGAWYQGYNAHCDMISITATSDDIVISGNFFGNPLTGATGNGIDCKGGLILTNFRIEDFTGIGLYCCGTGGETDISEGKIENCFQHLIELTNGYHDVNIAACNFESHDTNIVGSGFWINGTEELQVSACTFDQSTPTVANVILVNCSDCKFSGCDFPDAAPSVDLVDCSYITITGGDIMLCYTYGLVLNGSGYCTITGVSIRGASRAATNTYSDVLLTAYQGSSGWYDCLQNTFTGDNIQSGNTPEGTHPNYAIYIANLHVHDNIFAGNTISTCASGTVYGASTADGNNFTANWGYNNIGQ